MSRGEQDYTESLWRNLAMDQLKFNNRLLADLINVGQRLVTAVESLAVRGDEDVFRRAESLTKELSDACGAAEVSIVVKHKGDSA